MQVGICKVTLHMPANHSLKDKRRELKSIIERIKNRYDVSISEVEDQDVWQRATLGISYTSNSAAQADEVLSKVLEFINNGRCEAEIIECEREILSF